MQKLVKGATKPKATAPKAKYVEPILSSTYEGGHDFNVVMDALAKVIGSRNGSWPSLYKALIVIHIMIREGSEDVTLEYLARHPRMLDVEDHMHRAPAMGRYARYLATRGQQFKETHIDHVKYKSRQGFTRLHSLSIQKGLMRECNAVLILLEALMKCQYQEQDIVNDDVLLMAFRLLVHDALTLFQVLNEGVINLLEHFFELSKPDAEQALDIYRGFRRITAKVISYLRTAKELEFKTMLHVPNIKHAPTSLVSSLEMYLNDPDFDSNRRQYLAEKQAHEVKRTVSQSRGERKSEQRSVSTISAPPPKTTTSSSFEGAPLSQQHQLLQQQVQQLQQPQVPMVMPTQSVLSPQQPQPQPQQPQPQQPQQPQPQQLQPQHTLQPDGSNPFWQTQTEAANIQAADGQAQLQMQQLRQLQMQQVEQQELIRQQIQQLEQQRAAQQQAQPQFLEPHTTGFDFGLQPAPATQHIPQQQFTPQPPMQTIQAVQPQHTQPQIQAPPMQPLQPQSTDYNPFKRLPATPGTAQMPLTSSETGTNPFKSPQNSYAAQFSALDNVGSQMQPSLIDFGQPQAPQATGTNPFRT